MALSRKHSTGIFSKFLKPYGIIAKRLRKIRGKYVSRVHSSQNPTSQYLKFFSKVEIRHKIDRFDFEKYYAKSDTSDSNLNSDPEPKPETLVPTPKPINENTSDIEDIYDLYRSIWISS
ncbi:highly derived d5-like helicase-primase: PROVISIONAL [Gigaspora margarita]|uniref:Highly derived d5-like helicase-primase: PROVISIONAL n=1 Tax=Gigaspora margarita TaxID=4874 RepID=A0A8H4AE07_GIGMA|nr:highly derived d5-like helicase-primase: PROVISIONAL [Gigaspora margarita]